MKLVRNKIPELMHAEGRKPKVRIAKKAERLEFLKKKLVEEAAELLTADSDDAFVNEMVDIIDVVDLLKREIVYRKLQPTFNTAHLDKLAERGGFSEFFLWEEGT